MKSWNVTTEKDSRSPTPPVLVLRDCFAGTSLTKQVKSPWSPDGRNAYLKFHRELCSSVGLSCGRADYSGGKDGSDPFLNFKAVEHLGMGVTTEQGFLVRLADKIRRLSGFYNTGTFKVWMSLSVIRCWTQSIPLPAGGVLPVQVSGANCEGGPSWNRM